MERRLVIGRLMCGIEGRGPELKRTHRESTGEIGERRWIVMLVVDLELHPALPPDVRSYVAQLSTDLNHTSFRYGHTFHVVVDDPVLRSRVANVFLSIRPCGIVDEDFFHDSG